MDFKEIVAINGKPGLFEVITGKGNGLIVRSLLDKKTQYISARTHAFSILENISIYTYVDSEPLKDVLFKVSEHETNMPEPNADGKDLMSWFREVLPEFDESQVYKSDIKKVIKWYHLLKPLDMIKPQETDAQESDTGEEE